VSIDSELKQQALNWIEQDPDAVTKSQLTELLTGPKRTKNLLGGGSGK